MHAVWLCLACTCRRIISSRPSVSTIVAHSLRVFCIATCTRGKGRATNHTSQSQGRRVQTAHRYLQDPGLACRFSSDCLWKLSGPQVRSRRAATAPLSKSSTRFSTLWQAGPIVMTVLVPVQRHVHAENTQGGEATLSLLPCCCWACYLQASGARESAWRSRHVGARRCSVQTFRDGSCLSLACQVHVGEHAALY